MKYVVIALILLIHIGCIGDRHKPITCQDKDTVADEISMHIDLRKISVKEYIRMIQDPKIDQQHIHEIVVIPADSGWVTKEDVSYLIPLLSSQQTVPCIMMVFSSSFPSGKSTLGGHAATLIDSYQLHTRFPAQLTECPETDSSEIASVQKWWQRQNH